MNLDFLMDLVNAKCNEDARRAGVMTLGGLRSTLATLPPETPVVIDKGGAPGSLDSYRGYYERLAFAADGGSTTAREVIASLDAADGKTFRGYKGGDYEMDSYTFLHIAPYGSTGPQVVGLHIEDDCAVIDTKDEEW